VPRKYRKHVPRKAKPYKAPKITIRKRIVDWVNEYLETLTKYKKRQKFNWWEEE